VILHLESDKLGAKLEHIINFAGLRIFSMKSHIQRYLAFCQDIQISKYLLSINEFASNYPYDDNP